MVAASSPGVPAPAVAAIVTPPASCVTVTLEPARTSKGFCLRGANTCIAIASPASSTTRDGLGRDPRRAPPNRPKGLRCVAVPYAMLLT
jgi:hypothetical protein